MEDLRIYFGTYNVGTSNPDDSLLELLSLSSNPKNDKVLADFYVVGFQEVSAQPHHLLIDAFYEDPWTRALKEILSTRSYIKIKTIRLQGLVLNVFVLQKHLLNIREIESNYTRTGLAGMWGNKGGVSIRLGIYGCTICFVNAHLCAHDNQLDERIEDYNSIVREQEFHIKGNDKIFFHDYVFWMGDLNFRLLEEFDKTPEEIERHVDKGDLETLFKYDQLRRVMNKKAAFSELNENTPHFAPTFKFEVGESKYDHKRRPAWTDRILYAVHANNYENVKLNAEQKSYQSHPNYTLSDHKPVTAEFVIKTPEAKPIRKMDSQVFADYGEEIVKFDNIEQWWDNEQNTITYEFTKLHPQHRDDWIGVYRANFDCIDTYESYEYVVKSNASPSSQDKFGIKCNLKCAHDIACSCTQSSSKPSRKFNLTFSQPGGKFEGLYRLIYISDNDDKVRSILGVSQPFPVKSKV